MLSYLYTLNQHQMTSQLLSKWYTVPCVTIGTTVQYINGTIILYNPNTPLEGSTNLWFMLVCRCPTAGNLWVVSWRIGRGTSRCICRCRVRVLTLARRRRMVHFL